MYNETHYGCRIVINHKVRYLDLIESYTHPNETKESRYKMSKVVCLERRGTDLNKNSQNTENYDNIYFN